MCVRVCVCVCARARACVGYENKELAGTGITYLILLKLAYKLNYIPTNLSELRIQLKICKIISKHDKE